jgi:hypothetical protein
MSAPFQAPSMGPLDTAPQGPRARGFVACAWDAGLASAAAAKIAATIGKDRM